MGMNCTRGILLGSLLLAMCAEARIGETAKQLEARFGKGRPMQQHVTKPPTTHGFLFYRPKVVVWAYFIDKRCTRISYNFKGYLKKETALRLLKLNGKLWLDMGATRADGKTDGPKPEGRWRTKDGRVHAERWKNTMLFRTKEHLAAELAIRRKAEAEKLRKKNEDPLKGF